MGDPAIVVDRVWKKFRRGERLDSLRDLVPSVMRALLSGDARRPLHATEFWALRDVWFRVDPGEALGIIGPNGALIEVAAAFHPDLTGRENIYLQGAVLGMRRAEVTRKLEAIIEFAGVGDFIDTPVKRYSSGMHARLGFSVAAHMDPDVLLIDEVLSVGDMAFQQKCVDLASRV